MTTMSSKNPSAHLSRGSRLSEPALLPSTQSSAASRIYGVPMMGGTMGGSPQEMNNNNSQGHPRSKSINVANDGTGEFGDLLKGHIDIIEYLTTTNSSSQLSSLANVDSSDESSRGPTSILQQTLQQRSTQQPLTVLEPSSLAFGNSVSPASSSSPHSSSCVSSKSKHSPTNSVYDQRPGTSHSHATSIDATEPTSNKMYGGNARQPTTQHRARGTLPESPPETDASGGISASSPSSGSAHSPYSPEFQTYINGQVLATGSSVIHAPVGGVNNPLLAGAQSVILGVHDMSASNMNNAVQFTDMMPRTIVHHHQENNNGGAPSTSQQQQQYLMQQQYAQNHVLAPAQISPPNSSNSNGSAQAVCPQSPYISLQPQHILQHQPLLQQAPPQQHMSMDQASMYGDTSALLTNSQHSSRKRMRSDAGTPIEYIKPEPTSPRDLPDGYASSNVGDVNGQQTIKFNEWMPETWNPLYDAQCNPVPPLGFHVVATKGFSYSQFDNSFVNQKKNHTEIVISVQMGDHMMPEYIKTNVGYKKIREFQLNFYGVKNEQPSQRVTMKQSQTNRIPTEYVPARIDIIPHKMNQVKAPRLHFAETTQFNQRKNARPNPDQKYFNLLAALEAVTEDGDVCNVMIHGSDKVIVRASNPSTFDGVDAEAPWVKTPQGIAHSGNVMINMEKAIGALNVGGDIVYTGSLVHPSDRRIKKNIEEIDTADALQRLQKIRIVTYEIRPEVADEWGLTMDERRRVGVIAQELEEIIPDAVTDNGQFLQVDDANLFYHATAAVKEIVDLNEKMGTRVDEVEKKHDKIVRLMKMKRIGSIRSISTLPASSDFSSGVSSYMGGSFGSLASRTGNKKGMKEDEQALTSQGLDYSNSHRHCSHSCRADYGLCSQKWIQTSIVALVSIMALSVVLMAGLYSMDWYNRNHGHLSHRYYVGHNVTIHKIGHLVRPGGDGMILPAWTDDDRPDDLHAGNCTDGSCEQYCCASDRRYEYVMTNEDEEDEEEEEGNDQSSGGVRIVFQEHANARPLGLQFRALDVADVRSKRAIASGLSSPLQTIEQLGPASIVLPDLDVTLDSQYCWGTSCNEKNGNYTLYIPVSSYMPHIPLAVHFDTGYGGQVVQECDTELAMACLEDSNDVKKNVYQPTFGELDNGNKFELPVGYYTRSIYTFRVGYGTDLCAYDKEQVGRSFDQYKLIFYRVCNQ